MGSVELYSYRSLAGLLGIAEGTLRHWVMQGSIPYIKVGAHVRFSRARVEAWLAERERGAKPAKKPEAAAGNLPLFGEGEA